MLNYAQMVRLVNKAKKTRQNPDGSFTTFTSIEKIRTELWHNWLFNALQIEQSIESMKRQGLLTGEDN